jgi:hypothetical protein
MDVELCRKWKESAVAFFWAVFGIRFGGTAKIHKSLGIAGVQSQIQTGSKENRRIYPAYWTGYYPPRMALMFPSQRREVN